MTKTVRVVACILAVLMALSGLGMIALYISAAEVYDGTSVSASLSGAGTEADPYLIANGADLAYFAANKVDGASYKLTADIVWSSYTKGGEAPAASNWTAISAFNGTFDGNGYSISGIYVKGDKTAAMFATATGTIKNLTIKDSYFEGTKYISALVGQFVAVSDEAVMPSLTIENCVNYADLCTTKKDSLLGSMVGDSLGNSNKSTYLTITISNCVNYGKITTTPTSGTVYIGGIGGRVFGCPAVIENCANFGDIENIRVISGGILGQAGVKDYAGTEYATNIINCYNAGNISAVRICGGIIGRAYPGTNISNCVNTGNVTSTISLADAGADDGYCAQFGPITGHGADASADAATYTNCGVITNCYTSADAVVSNSSEASVSAFYASAATVKTAAELNSDAMVAALGEAYELVDGKLTLKIVATAGKVEIEQPEETTPETTEPAPETSEPAPETSEPAPETTEPAPETTEPGASGDTSDSAIFYVVIAVMAIAATAVIAKRREN